MHAPQMSGTPGLGKVQAYDADGVLSPASDPAVGQLAAHRVYLPLVARD
jgi:hypothetical protein